VWFAEQRSWVFGSRRRTVLVPSVGKPIRLMDGIAPELFDYVDTAAAANAGSFRIAVSASSGTNLGIDPNRIERSSRTRGTLLVSTSPARIVDDLVAISKSPGASKVGAVLPYDISMNFEMPQRYPRGW
jgi:hypothetical protein